MAEKEEAPAPPGEEAVAAAKVPVEDLSNAARFNSLFFEAVSYLAQGRTANASEVLISLRQQAALRGYKNLPTYSFTLLERATTAAEKGRMVDAKFLAERAVELSPNDARVHFSAASRHEIIGVGKASEFFFLGITEIWRRPSALFTAGSNLFLLFLSAVTLSLFLICIVQFALHGTHVYRAIKGLNPRKLASPAAILLFGAALIVPMFGGVLFAIACWTLLISRTVPGAKWLFASTGVVILCWG